MISTQFELQKFDRECQFYFLPTFWYEQDTFGHIRWHSLCFAWANATVRVDLELR